MNYPANKMDPFEACENNIAMAQQQLIIDCPEKKYSSLEFDSYENIIHVQNKLLRNHINYTVTNSPYYKSLFRDQELDPGSINCVADLKKIVCTTKTDINKHNRDFLACSELDIADVCLTSGTTGDRPTVLFQSFSDLSRLAYNEAAAFNMADIKANDTMLICAALDRCFMAGLAYYLGGLKIGAKMVRAGAGSAAQQWHMVKTTTPTVIVGVPSLIHKIGEYALEIGDEPDKIGINRLIAIGEPVKDENLNPLPATDLIEKMWAAPIYSTYASTEMATAFCECPERKGGHIRPELIITEILDDKGEPVEPGKTGEIIITPLGVKGMPLIRFKTGDISFMIKEPCGCGRRTPRLGPVLGRKNQMLKLKGTTVFPSSFLSVVEGMENVSGAYVEVKKHKDATDSVTLYAAAESQPLSVETIAENLRARVRVVPEIKIITAQELNNKIFQPGKRKKTTFFDLRD